MENKKEIVKEKYGKIVEDTSKSNSCCCGSSCCGSEEIYFGFNESYGGLEGYNPEADFNLGCGVPTEYAGIKKGDHVLDLGSGAGNDCFVARAIVGESGKVTGLDFTEPMIKKAKQNRDKLGFNNIDFILGDIEEMPLDSATFDVVISNCVLNLVPDKSKAFKEIFRVLKPGGHFCVSDVVTIGDLPINLKNDAELFVGCVSGAIKLSNYLGIIEKSGFKSIRVDKQKRIVLPDDVISKHIPQNGIKSFNEGENGIFSVTVSAGKE